MEDGEGLTLPDQKRVSPMEKLGESLAKGDVVEYHQEGAWVRAEVMSVDRGERTRNPS